MQVSVLLEFGSCMHCITYSSSGLDIGDLSVKVCQQYLEDEQSCKNIEIVSYLDACPLHPMTHHMSAVFTKEILGADNNREDII